MLHSLNIFLVLSLSTVKYLSILLFLPVICRSSLSKILSEDRCCFTASLLREIWFWKIEIYSHLLHFFPVWKIFPLSDVKVLNTSFGILVVSCFIASNIEFLLLSSIFIIHILYNICFSFVKKNRKTYFTKIFLPKLSLFTLIKLKLIYFFWYTLT